MIQDIAHIKLNGYIITQPAFQALNDGMPPNISDNITDVWKRRLAAAAGR